MTTRRIAILGSTGSIGRSTLSVAESYPERFEIVALAAGSNLDAAFELARTGGDLTPLLDTVRRWWFEADTWRDPAARHEYQARVSRSHCRPAAAEPAGDPRAGPRTVRRLDACTGGNWTSQ